MVVGLSIYYCCIWHSKLSDTRGHYWIDSYCMVTTQISRLTNIDDMPAFLEYALIEHVPSGESELTANGIVLPDAGPVRIIGSNMDIAGPD